MKKITVQQAGKFALIFAIASLGVDALIAIGRPCVNIINGLISMVNYGLHTEYLITMISTNVGSIASGLFGLAPAILFIVYFLLFYKNNKKHVFLPITYMVGALWAVGSFFSSIFSLFSILGFDRHPVSIITSVIGTVGSVIGSFFTLAIFVVFIITHFMQYKPMKIAKIAAVVMVARAALSFVLGLVLNFVFQVIIPAFIYNSNFVTGFIGYLFAVLGSVAGLLWAGSHFLLWFKGLEDEPADESETTAENAEQPAEEYAEQPAEEYAEQPAYTENADDTNQTL